MNLHLSVCYLTPCYIQDEAGRLEYLSLAKVNGCLFSIKIYTQEHLFHLVVSKHLYDDILCRRFIIYEDLEKLSLIYLADIVLINVRRAKVAICL